MSHSAQTDRFVHDRLPPASQWPALRYELPELQQLALTPRLNLVERLLNHALGRGFAKRPLLRSPTLTLSYAEVCQRVDQLAQVLVQDLGLEPGNRVLLRGGNSIEMMLAWLAVVKAGLIAVASMPLLRAKELGEIVEKALPAVALCDARWLDELLLAQAQHPALKTIVPFGQTNAPGSLAALASTKTGPFTACDTAGDDIALLAFTSGTTGKPKAAVHTHRDVLAACEAWPCHVLKATPDDIVMGSPPLAFTFGLGGLLVFPMWAGASVYLPDVAYTPQAMASLIFESGATICYTAPTFYRQMAPFMAQELQQRGQPPRLRICVSAGEGLPDATRQLWKTATGIELLDGIGATEMFHIFVSSQPGRVRPGAIGQAVPGYSAQVVDESGQEVPRGTLGKLVVVGPTGCRYMDDARQANYVKDGLNYPGDAFVQDADGYFFFQSRTDDMIVTAGYNVAAPEVEEALLQHAAVLECAVIGQPDEARGMVVKAFCVLKPGHASNADMVTALQDFVKATIAPFKYPRQIEFLTSLPRTETGKLQRFKLKSPPLTAISRLDVQTHITTLQPAGWAPAKGYANGIVARGNQIFVGGQIGWNAQQQFESDDFIAQTAQALRNIAAILQEAGAGPEHMVRLTWYIIDRVEYQARLKELGQVYREVMGRNFPAMTCVQVAALVEARAKVEIEATAVLPG